MKTGSTILQVFALAACLSAQALSGGQFPMPGFRRAMQTISHSVSIVAETALPSAG